MRRGGRLAAAVLLIPSLLVQSTGAADLAFLAAPRPPAALLFPPNHAAWHAKPPAGPRVSLPREGLWGRLRDAAAPTVYAWDRWLAQPLEFPDLPFPEEAAGPQAVPAAPEAPAPALPDALPAAPEPIADRMLIDHHDFDMVAFGEEARQWRGVLPPTHQVVAPVLQGPWRSSRGLRYRINYLKPEGLITLRDGRIDVTEGGRSASFLRRVPLGPQYWRTYALYHEGDLVDYEIELVNDTGRDLPGLLVFTNQEGFNPSGRIGRLLDRVQLSTFEALVPGGRVVLRGRARLSGFAAAGSNFEQTHLTVETEEGKNGRTRLVDDPQAGIVDPPRSR